MPFKEAWLLIGPGLILLGFGTGEPVVTGVGFAVLLLGGVARLWHQHLFDRVTLTRSLSERRAFAGDPVTLTVELENRKLLPLPWYEWRVAVPDDAVVEGEHLAAAAAAGFSWIHRRGAIGWYERQEWTFTVRIDQRGYHQFGPGSMQSADLLGLFPRSTSDDTRTHLVIFPRVYPLEDLGFPAVRPFGEIKGRNPIFEDPRRIAGVREYRPGDPLRRIDWKATARSGELRSRVYEPSASRQFYVLLNIDTLSHSWEGYLKDELERAVSTAASISVWAAGAGHAIGLLANGSYPGADRPIRLPPSSAADQVTRVLEALAMVQPLTLNDLADVVHRERGRIVAGSTIVVVASLIPEALAGALRRLAGEGHAVFVIATSDRIDATLLGDIPMRRLGGAFQRPEVPA